MQAAATPGLLALPNELLLRVCRMTWQSCDMQEKQVIRMRLDRVCKRFKALRIDEGLVCVRYASQAGRLITCLESDAKAASAVTYLSLELLDPTTLSRNRYIGTDSEGMPLHLVRTIAEARTAIQGHADVFSKLLSLLSALERLSLSTCPAAPYRDLLLDMDYEIYAFEHNEPAIWPLDTFLLALAKLPCMERIKMLSISAPITDSENNYLIEAAGWYSVCSILDAVPDLEHLVYRVPFETYGLTWPDDPILAFDKLQTIETSFVDLLPRLFELKNPDQVVSVKLVMYARLGKEKTNARLLAGAQTIHATALVLNEAPRATDAEPWEVENGGPISIKTDCVDIQNLDYAKQFFDRLTNLRQLDLGMIGEPSGTVLTGIGAEFSDDCYGESHEHLIALIKSGCLSNLERLTVLWTWGIEEWQSLQEACDGQEIDLVDSSGGRYM